jgi:hypothetical protein
MPKTPYSSISETVIERVCDKVTKRNIEKALAKQNKYIDARFAKQNKYIDARFGEQKEYIDARFEEQAKHLDTIIDIKIDQKLDEFRDELRGKFAELMGAIADLAGMVHKFDQERTIYSAQVTGNTQRIDDLEVEVFGTARVS